MSRKSATRGKQGHIMLPLYILLQFLFIPYVAFLPFSNLVLIYQHFHISLLDTAIDAFSIFFILLFGLRSAALV